MALSDIDRQRLIEATRKHRSRLGIDPTTGKATANKITRRSALVATFSAVVARVAGKRGDK